MEKCRVFTCCLVAILLIFTKEVVGQTISVEEVEASYILKLSIYTQVDVPSRHVSTICYYEKPDVPFSESTGQILERYVQSKPTLNGNPVSVKKFQAIRNLTGCDIFYIPRNEEANIDNILTALGKSSTLTVSSSPRFIVRGGMIGFVMDDNNRIKMEANLENIRKRDIKMASAVLEIMQQIVGN